MIKIIRDFLDKGKIKYIEQSDYGTLSTGDNKETTNQFADFVRKSKTRPISILMLTPDELNSEIPELVKFRKTGYQFVRPSVLL